MVVVQRVRNIRAIAQRNIVNASTTNSITNLIANRPTSSTCSWSKLYQSNNINK